MPNSADNGLKYMLALVRIAVGVIFLLFAEYKVFETGFAHGGMQKWIGGFLQNDMVVHWYRPFLENVVMPHATLFAYLFGAGELLVGLALVTGVWVRPAAAGGAFMMLNLLLSEWIGVGPNARIWQYFGAQLDHICPLMIFLILMAEREPQLSLRRFFPRSSVSRR
jgi:thiosulfate dehydrogenase (quinone) large subunit